MDAILKHVYNACDPFEPASAEFYVDCAAARGEGALTENFRRRLALEDGHLRYLFSGHIGCGKSSELAVLKRCLDVADSGSPERYFTVLLDAHEYLDDFDVTPSDILLAIVTELADALREHKPAIELKDNYFKNLWGEVKDVLFSKVELEEIEAEGEPSFFGTKLGKVTAKIKLLKRDPEARAKVRGKLAPRVSSMREEINSILDDARLQVRNLTPPANQPRYKDIVLILDNLEKIQRVDSKGEGEASQKQLFVERAPQLTGLLAHVIYTVPLRLARAESEQLRQRYGEPPFVLPMVKVRERNGKPYEQGLDFLKALLQKRLGGHQLEEVFEPQALKYLLHFSGGHVRNLMTFVQVACTHTDTAPIPLAAAQQAVMQTVRSYTAPDIHWEKMALLADSPDQQFSSDDRDYLAMLENLSVLEYINGGDCLTSESDDLFSFDDRHVAPWYAVNPIMEQMTRFKQEMTKLRSKPAS
jgi:hypothetical protein